MRIIRALVFAVCAALALNAAGSDQHAAAPGLSGVPAAAQATISAALGKRIPAYAARKQSGRFLAVNAEQHLRSTFTAREIEVRSGSVTWRMALERYGYGADLEPLATAVPEADGNRIQYRRGALTEWYINGPIGLEQGFTINRPPGQSRGQELTIELALSGNLSARKDDDQQVTLRDAAGESRLRYSGLQARDCTGRELASRLEVERQRLLLHVNDRNARYPIIVDPWVQTAELTASDGAAGDQFGWSVSASGNTVVVGAPFHAVGLNLSQGAAYVFVEPPSGWTSMKQTAELVASDGAALSFFGSSVAISGDTIVVGAGGSTVHGNPHQGAAYVFVKPGNGWKNTTQNAKLTASDGYVGDDFGAAIAISGNTVVVGAPYASIGSDFQQGAAYVFVQPNGGWANMTQTAKLTASDGNASDIFGGSVAVDGNTVVAGASEASVSGNNSAGKAYLFVQPNNAWTNMTQTAELTASDAMTDDYLGSSVAVSGNTAIAGAPSDYSGAAYVFVKPPGGWTDAAQTAELTPTGVTSPLLLGTSVAVNETTVMAGAVATKVNGNPYEGALYMFAEPPGGWIDENQSAKLISSDGGAGDYFGRSVSLSGNVEAIGAPFHTFGLKLAQGAAYVFQAPNPRPSETSLSPSSAIVGGPGFQLTVGGTNFVTGAVVTWSGSARSTTYVSSTVLQAQILASDIAKLGNVTVKVTNPPPGGGNSNGLTFSVQNPVPKIDSLSPSKAQAGGPTFTLTVNGSNFVSSSKVYWNSDKLTTTFVSSTVLKANVPASEIKTAGTASVVVFNPTPGGGTSNAKSFTIYNPVPSLTSLNPSRIKAGSLSFTLSIYGSGFVTASQALWNGSARATTYVGAGKLEAKILKSDVAKAGTAKVTVSNPTPGGGTSNALTFTITQ
ncbi:MAG: IPT/TIG domain-containing protein [Terriglobales bacterium]